MDYIIILILLLLLLLSMMMIIIIIMMIINEILNDSGIYWLFNVVWVQHLSVSAHPFSLSPSLHINIPLCPYRPSLHSLPPCFHHLFSIESDDRLPKGPDGSLADRQTDSPPSIKNYLSNLHNSYRTSSHHPVAVRFLASNPLANLLVARLFSE